MVEHQQSSLIDHLIAESADLICICNDKGTVVKINKRFAENTGKVATELVGISIQTIFSDQNKKLNELLYNAVLAFQHESQFNNNIKDTDGRLHSVSWRFSKFENLTIIRGVFSKTLVNSPLINTDKRFKTVVDNASDCFFLLDSDFNIIFQNKAAIKTFTHPQFKDESNIFFGSFPEETNRKFFDHFTSALNTNTHLRFVEFSPILNCWFDIDVLPYENDLNILVNDISDRIIDQKINELELKTFELNIAKNKPIAEVLLSLLEGFEGLYPHLHASILKIENEKIVHVVSPRLPLKFCWAIDGETIGPDQGSCGAAAYYKKSVISFDIETDQKWTAFFQHIQPFGYKSCWSFPILSNKSSEVMATFAIYTKENLLPTQNELKSIARLCNIIKIIFENLKQDDTILLMNNRYEMVTMATNDAIYDWDLKTKRVYWSENLFNIFGFTPAEAQQTKNWWINHIHKDDRNETISLLKKCLKDKKSGWVAEYRLKCANGIFKHVYNRGYILYDSQNTPMSIIGAIQDISGLKEREIEITIQNNKLKEIAQISSHELRRPVTSILGLISLFNSENLADDNNGIIIEYLRKATQELDDVIHSIVSKTLEADETIYDKARNFRNLSSSVNK
ncbi:PAS domain S-box protein [Pedobacter arcticus]|uniref:PAS domain S-box protein n=1 Tax=Pedobacter arcticus TaxID=752140 RepID=UPI0002FAF74C|nr:PAS domain S-box protein [Pedobacter arcticus]